MRVGGIWVRSPVRPFPGQFDGDRVDGCKPLRKAWALAVPGELCS